MACICRADGIGLSKWLRAAALLGSASLYMCMPGARGQSSGSVAPMPPQTVEDALHQMSDAAGVIFAGQVLSVRLAGAGAGATGVMEVVFRVDQAVRGCVAGETYVLKEWPGLWAGGDRRYQAGQRLLMLLRAPGVAGMSSPVGGMDGAIPIRGVESEIVTGSLVAGASVAGSAAGSASGPVAMVDLRWVAARMLRSVSYPSASSAAGSGNVVSGATVGSGSSRGSASVAVQGASVGTVVGLLGSWEAARVAQ